MEKKRYTRQYRKSYQAVISELGGDDLCTPMQRDMAKRLRRSLSDRALGSDNMAESERGEVSS